MKTPLITFVLGAIAGAFGMFLVGSDHQEQSEVAPEKERAPLRAFPDADKKTIARLEKKIAALESTSTARDDDEKPSTIVKAFGPGNTQIDLKQIQKHIAKGEKERAEKQVESRLATLADRLNLTGDQITSVRELLEEEAKQKGGISLLLDAAFTSNGVEATRTLVTPHKADPDSPSFDDKLRELLDDDQGSAYDEYLTAKNENAIEASANAQLAQLQTTVPDLSKEQKDQAFNEFARISREDIETHGSQPVKDGMTMDFSRMEAEKKASKAAMKEILSPEQMAVYESQSSGRTFSLGGSSGSGSGIMGAGIKIHASEIISDDPGDSAE